MTGEAWIDDGNIEPSDRCGFEGGGCTTAAAWHLMSESAIHGLVALSACPRHHETAKSAGLFHGEHPFGPDCVPVQTIWFPDACRPVEPSTGRG